MTLPDYILIITGMFIVTFGVRFVLFARADKVVMPAFVEKALKFVPVAVLTSIITPMTLMPNKHINISLDNPWLLGAIAAFVVGIWRQQQLLTIVVGVLVFFVAKYW
ncbi:Branched-chain amino acid transport protein (AzlD) [Marinomonas spartinae]|uniref:Branched-chain amino acid transport protein (AzlD) n=1 Tax=Marinomonas spartinae TaxID=1792290 RepID=A0A1A8TN42_9GAMM|nr:AzlD domain-containing protein [Marinomonas spartinae]SBS34350.1 Branched-chain amino acid transport protein (AzlD) [Marinomonas spartinae]SBS37513.1 Branched-chain amino acid transport protein (AzlD) [Marinomonas spartinae]